MWMGNGWMGKANGYLKYVVWVLCGLKRFWPRYEVLHASSQERMKWQSSRGYILPKSLRRDQGQIRNGRSSIKLWSIGSCEDRQPLTGWHYDISELEIWRCLPFLLLNPLLLHLVQAILPVWFKITPHNLGGLVYLQRNVNIDNAKVCASTVEELDTTLLKVQTHQ